MQEKFCDNLIFAKLKDYILSKILLPLVKTCNKLTLLVTKNIVMYAQVKCTGLSYMTDAGENLSYNDVTDGWTVGHVH
jgi:hypothetical protein